MKRNHLAIAISLALATTSAYSTEEVDTQNQEDEIEVIQVRGVLSSLKEAQSIKKEADNVVDALVAEDIGKFPDSNVAEAMQRIPGVSVNRLRGEGQSITVRGLSGDYNVTTLNGRKIASETVGRDFNYDLIAAELIGGVQVNKTQQASLPEGGIGAIINIDTLKPLNVGSKIAGSIEGYYNERAGEVDPQASFLISETFNDEELGILFSANRTSSFTRFDSHSAQWGWNEWNEAELMEGGNPEIAGRLPSWPNVMVSTDKRERTGGTLGIQWRPTSELDINFDALYTKYEIESTGNMISLALFEGTNMDNIQDVSFGEDGHSNSITIGEPGNMGSPAIAELLEAQNPRDSETYQVGLNVNYIWDNFNFNFDAAYSEAEDSSAAVSWVVIRTAIDTLTMNWDNGQQVPDISFGDTTLDENIDYGGWYARVNGDKIKDKTGNFIFDGTYEPEDSFISKVLFGTGYNMQDKGKTFWDQENASAYTFRNGATDSEWVNAPDSEKVDIAGNTLWGPLPDSAINPGSFDDFMGGTGANLPNTWAGINIPGLFDYYRSLDADAFDQYLTTHPNLSGGNTYGVKEETIHAYAELIIEDEIAGMPYMLDFGLRYIDTTVTSWGYSQDPANIVFDENGLFTDAVDQVGLVEFEGNYSKFLPSINSKLGLTDDLYLRVALSQAISRPPLTNLSPVTSLWQNEEKTPPENFMYENDPGLEPYYADQFDTALEWYYSDTGTLNAAFFYKELHGFVIYEPTHETIAGADFEITRPYNDDDNESRIRGYELNWLQTFDELLPDSLAGFGISANYTYNNSESGEFTEDGEQLPFKGLSDNQYNIVGFYEQHGFMVNIAYNYRSEYSLGKQWYWSNELSDYTSETLQVDEWGQLDMQFGYDINEHITLTFEANNLLDPDYVQYLNGDKNHVDYISSWGRSYRAGVRFNF
ncbi:TonB-dependent receptor [Shewanella sp. UCD-KL12]|uniref:TonB-dependent receptor n=1 Tax=Shewanella sp. UCD-KL12 TaxID=1917163 RepID=UPI0009714A60|nr:TonB-dependent receptor [Shewanella sp. UCD-KL12]